MRRRGTFCCMDMVGSVSSDELDNAGWTLVPRGCGGLQVETKDVGNGLYPEVGDRVAQGEEIEWEFGTRTCTEQHCKRRIL
ncbi:hypothetical protein M0657_004346 [Pyricularia oryzae]|uniref:Uncharacterized protein n=2 Tax=Pyricularia oryzae TaxID=318829 RepID=A0AA97P875_PYRO3|nr:hypothetical protein OOU_Y34scaffold00126g69 [Pyricularia oryzae Y34]KAI7923621.1 hypothetical protein M9X92_004231 [Pyricularia oryzae]KAI7925180.1 hypothetical protein M0657_004346 [Pyricularia oryzae]